MSNRIKYMSKRRSGRVTVANASSSELLGSVYTQNPTRLKPFLNTSSFTSNYLGQVEDHRYWNPENELLSPTYRTSSSRRVRLVAPKSIPRRNVSIRPYVPKFSIPSFVAFESPRSTVVCIKRRRRKEVIHALGIAGSRVRRPTRNWSSSISCRG